MTIIRLPVRPGPREHDHEEDRWEEGVNEVRVARYRDLIRSGRYRRSARELAERIVEQDLDLFPAAPRWQPD